MEQPNLKAPLPAVDPADVQALWRFMKMASPSLGNSSKGGESAETYPSAVGFCRDLLAEHCSAGADVNAVFLRTMLLRTALDSGLLAPWQNDAELSVVVFQVAATFPIPRLASFDLSGFVTKLRDTSGLR
jgi:hypothetical protein